MPISHGHTPVFSAAKTTSLTATDDYPARSSTSERVRAIYKKTLERVTTVQNDALRDIKLQAEGGRASAHTWKQAVLREECLLQLRHIKATQIQVWLDSLRRQAIHSTLTAPVRWASLHSCSLQMGFACQKKLLTHTPCRMSLRHCASSVKILRPYLRWTAWLPAPSKQKCPPLSTRLARTLHACFTSQQGESNHGCESGPLLRMIGKRRCFRLWQTRSCGAMALFITTFG